MAAIGQFVYTVRTDIPEEIQLSSVKKIGIQAPVGMKFSFNDKTNQIEMGVTGIYELDFSNISNGSITGPLYIDKSSNSLPNEDGFTILIDYVTMEEEE